MLTQKLVMANTKLTSAGAAFNILSFLSMLDLFKISVACKEWNILSRKDVEKRLASTPSLLFEATGKTSLEDIWTIRLFSLFINNSDLNISKKLALEIIQNNLKKTILRIRDAVSES